MRCSYVLVRAFDLILMQVQRMQQANSYPCPTVTRTRAGVRARARSRTCWTWRCINADWEFTCYSIVSSRLGYIVSCVSLEPSQYLLHLYIDFPRHTTPHHTSRHNQQAQAQPQPSTTDHPLHPTPHTTHPTACQVTAIDHPAPVTPKVSPLSHPTIPSSPTLPP